MGDVYLLLNLFKYMANVHTFFNLVNQIEAIFQFPTNFGGRFSTNARAPSL